VGSCPTAEGADVRRATSRVLILTATEYSCGIEALLLPAIKAFQLELRGKSVLLKPNLVEHVPGKPVNTHPKLVGAACDCFPRLGAKSVTVAEGPGHERDTELILKTHHWAGVTLSMKNMFGVVPGMKYGWPKNVLHWQGIHESILDVCATVPVHFVIADGIEAMEGNGPLQGEHRKLNRIVLADASRGIRAR
jgi:uncharacterized protein (DUF362 family)